jgi:hypothetical protein
MCQHPLNKVFCIDFGRVFFSYRCVLRTYPVSKVLMGVEATLDLGEEQDGGEE